MSKPSTAPPSSKTLPAKSAWLQGPPSSASSPRSQSPAPTQSQPHLTHSRRPSALGQGINIKDGVSIPRSNVGAAATKQGSAVTFGSIDDASAPISSSPAAPNPIKESVVKSFGTVPAAPSAQVNGKSSVSSRPAAAPLVASSSSTASSAASAPSTSATSSSSTATKPKINKADIAKLFQTSSSPAPTPAETQSPSSRTGPLPSQPSSSQTPGASQPSQFGPQYTPFVPGGRPQPQNSGPGSGPSRSPVYQRPPQNGTGPRSQGPPNGTPSTGLSSPRLAPPQPAGVPPAAPQVPGQPPMGAPPMMWPHYPYYTEYVPYPAWGYMPQSPHHHPQHLPPGSHMPPMPMSPHNPPRNIQTPGTPTMSHAAPNPAHPPHPPPPLSHPVNNASVSSPPPTPSSTLSPAGRLNATSNTFVPQHRPPSKITLKSSDGKEINLEALKSNATSSNNASSTSGQGSPYRQASPGTPKRASIRMETEEQRKKRLAEEEEKEKEKQRAQAEAEEKAKKKKEEEERKAKEEEERKKREEEEKERERVRKEEEEKERERLRIEEEERKKREEEERQRQEEKRIRKEEEERKRQEEEEQKRQEEERLKKEEEERRRKEEEERAKEEEERKKQEEEKKRQEEAEEAKRRQEAEEKARSEAQTPEEGEVAEPGRPSKEEIKERAKEALRINTSAGPTSNPAELGRKRPGPLDLSATKNAPVVSALSTARIIDNINAVKYPEGIQSPKPELNEYAKPGQFRYDRDFLLQFMSVCKEKPPNLPPLDAIGLEPIDQASLAMHRGGSGRHRNASSSVPSRQSSIGLPFGGPGSFGKGGNFPMGQFTTPNKSDSDARFAASNRAASVNAGSGLSFGGRPGAPMQRTASQGGQLRERTRSKRGEKRPPADGGKGGNQQDRNASNSITVNLEPVAPLEKSANRWDRKALAADVESPEMVDRKVKGLLNKLTMEKFDSISDQIVQWANRSEKEKDGRTLIQVIRLVFEKATDEATWSEMYARLCRKMMERISPSVQDDGIKGSDGKPIAGGQLFRKYLLNRCQEDFERGWVNKEATAAAAATKAAEDEAVKAANSSKEGGDEEVALYSDEYYAAQKAKRQGLGLIKFIGELFKLQMLTERIMHECVKKLLGNVQNPEEEEIESLCKLLTTVGAILDTPKAHAHMDIYFSRMKELTKSPNVSPRMQFMLQDVIELRARKWVARNAVAVPKTLAEVQQDALKEAATKEKEYNQRQSSMSRTSSNRGSRRPNDAEQTNPDGWAVAGSNQPRPPPKAGDLSHFGKISKNQPMSFGPSSIFTKNKGGDKRESISRSSSNSNMFMALSQSAEGATETKAEPPQRKRLVLQPRSVPKENESPVPGASGPADTDSSNESEEEESAPPAAPEINEKDADKKIDEDVKELFAVRNLDEAEVYFTALPVKYHHKLVDKVVMKAVESKAADSDLVASFFERASSKGLCSPESFEEGLVPLAEIIDDIAVDAPMAFQLFVKMVKGTGLSEEARRRVASKSMGDVEKLTALLL